MATSTNEQQHQHQHDRRTFKPQNSSAFKIHVGMRNIKTALAATLTATLYMFFDRNPTFACIGAIFGMGSDMVNSRLNGGNRFFGTLIGGFIGMGLFGLYTLIYPQGGVHPPILLFLFVGVILLVMISLLFKWPGAIQPGGVLVCIILYNTPVNSFVSYSLNRMVDTGIGVLIALLVNYLLPRERTDRWLTAIGIKKAHYHVEMVESSDDDDEDEEEDEEEDN